jgi:nucleotide-binding universal stress UspA family protein
MSETSSYQLFRAIEDFRKARQRAGLEQLLARLSGKSDDLLSYEEVRQKLRGVETSVRSLEDIPLDAIIGSAGRYNDFTRSFLPKEDTISSRWASVKAASNSPEGLPPIEVYKIGNAYFVKDGNHRVSVARQRGDTHIQAYVAEIKTRVPLAPEDDPDSLILKTEYTEFLEHTHLDTLRPEADLHLTVPGMYPVLEGHIREHQYFLGLEQQRDIPFEEAVISFYDKVYLPIVQVIRETGLLRSFPNRTEADLYLWITEHRESLKESLDMDVTPVRAALDLVEQKSSRPERIASRIGGAILGSLVPDELDPGPPTGTWRRTILENVLPHRLFRDVLIPVSGNPEGWLALEQAITLARLERSYLNGLHVVADGEQRDSPEAQQVKAEFERRCWEAGVPGHLVIQLGSVSSVVTERARWNDLLVILMAFPPGNQPLAKLASGLHTILRRSAIPILAVPAEITTLQHALLAFDGSRESIEALYLAAYLRGAWAIQLTILSVAGSVEQSESTLGQAREYLQEHHLEAEYIAQAGEVSKMILETAQEKNCDWIISGSYGPSPLVEVVLGSTLDILLKETKIPILICR